MDFEILISTMHKTNIDQVLSMLRKSNVYCNALVVVQTDRDGYEEVSNDGRRLRVFYTKERGLSRSRNMALKNSDADVVLLADDDLIYFDGFEKIIVDSFYKNSNYDFIIFNVDNYNKKYPDRKREVLWHHLLGFSSFQIAFRKKKVVDENIQFDIDFGTGSGVYNSGEENIFLSNCYRTSKMLYVPQKIVSRPQTNSSWFTGYDEKFLFDRGAIFYAISPKFVYLLILQFCIRRKSLFPNYKFSKLLNIMLKGMSDYKKRKLSRDD